MILIVTYREVGNDLLQNPRVHGIINSVLMVCIAVQLLRPAKTFLTSDIYRVMGKVASEETWGIVMFVVGAMRVTAILISITKPLNSRAMSASFFLTFVSVGIWLGMSSAFYAANPFGISCLAFLALAAHDGTNFDLVAKLTGVTQGRERTSGPPSP